MGRSDPRVSDMAPPTSVVVHPLVLLSTMDHYSRVAKDTRNRVVGVLLGESSKGVIDITNSFAVPFDEDARNPAIWYLDHDFLDQMYTMFKKVAAKEKIVGWYSTGPRIKPADLEIHEIFRKFCPNPVYVVIDVKPREMGIPTEAYVALQEEKDDGTQALFTFHHVPSEIGAYEAEEIGVEHLLRDIKDTSVSTLAQQVTSRLNAMKGLHSRLADMQTYLENVVSGKLPLNHQIIAHMQDVFNLLPNLSIESMVKAFSVKTNDMMVIIYVASMIRSVIALHNVINNKIENKEAEVKTAKEKEEKVEQAKKEKEEKEKAKAEKTEGDEKKAESDAADKSK